MKLYCDMCGATMPDYIPPSRMIMLPGLVSVMVCSESCERTYISQMEEEEEELHRRRDPLGEAFTDLLRSMGATIIDVTPGDEQ